MKSLFSALIAALAAMAFATSVSALDDASIDDDPRLGDKVDRICFARGINGFRLVDDYDRVVLLNRGVNNWYLVKLGGACSNTQLRFAQSVAIDTRPSGGCLNRGDRLIFSDSFGFRSPSEGADIRRCFVNSIYDWDEDAVEEEPEEDPKENPDAEDIN